MTKAAADLSFDDLKVGQTHQFTQKLTEADGQKFADLSGDHNPLHVDQKYAAQTEFGQRVVHGMHVSSFFSALVGMHCPGKRSLWMSQTLNFRQPLFYGDTIEVRGTVTDKSESLRMITLKTEVYRDGKLMVDGQARVKLLENTK